MGNGCTQPVMGGSGSLCLPTSSHLRQIGGEVAGLPVQQCVLVLGPSGHVQSDPTVPVQFGDSTIQRDPAQKSVKPEHTCLAPRATAIKGRASLRQWQHELRLLKRINQISL